MEEKEIDIIDVLGTWIKSLSIEDYGTFSSILGFILSIVLLLLVNNIKNKYLKKIRTPEIIKDLGTIATNISIGLEDFEKNKVDIFNELGKCNSILKNLYPKIKPDIQKEIKPLVNQLKIEKNYFSRKFGATNLYDFKEDDIYNVYIQINSIKESLIQEEKDLRFE